MKKAGSSIVILIFLSVLAHSQNLVGNPGFEASTVWDSLWVLSLAEPSSKWAVATADTNHIHEGTRCVELSNTLFNRWTYFYTDSIRAPLVFSAKKSYEVAGWIKILEQGKGASLSVFWNGSQKEKIIYAGNPDPITDPDWFRVNDTITPVSDYKDGYLGLGMRAGKNGRKASGKLLFDDLSVVRLPDNKETEITAFSVPEQTGIPIINDILHTITVEVPEGTDRRSLAPDLIALSRGAAISPDTGVAKDFTNPVIYTVTAQDELTTQEWIVTVLLPPGSDTDILAFFFPEQTGPAVIDTANHEIHIEVRYGTVLASLVPDIEVSSGASLDPPSGTAVDFSSPVIYTVTAEDGITIQEWTALVTLSSPCAETDITAFSFKEQEGKADIDTISHEVIIEVPWDTEVSALTPVVEVSPGASVDPPDGMTADFTDPVVFTVTAQDSITVQEWTVQVVVLPSREADITAFSFNGQRQTATIDTATHTVSFEVPFGTAVDALTPVIEVSPGASVDPASGVTADFTDPVVYTVTAEDGITVREWTVQVVVLPNTETDILSFSFEAQTGPAAIDHEMHTIAVEVAKETDLTALVPAIELSPGATVDPPGGSLADFTSDVTYTVTAEDGLTTQEWTVSVTLDPAVSVPGITAASLFRAYPNPAHHLLVVDVLVPGQIIILDILGRSVISVGHASGRILVPLTGLEQGIYFVRMEHADRDQINRIIIH